jgi:hypothetical protein
MNTEQDNVEGQFGPLRQEYDQAFHEWVESVRLLELLNSLPTPPRVAVERAKQRAAEAENVYRQRRNRIAELVLASPAAQPSGVAAGKSVTQANMEHLARALEDKDNSKGEPASRPRRVEAVVA